MDFEGFDNFDDCFAYEDHIDTLTEPDGPNEKYMIRDYLLGKQQGREERRRERHRFRRAAGEEVNSDEYSEEGEWESEGEEYLRKKLEGRKEVEMEKGQDGEGSKEEEEESEEDDEDEKDEDEEDREKNSKEKEETCLFNTREGLLKPKIRTSL